jgi:NADH-quinone oxidoreductase subunit J
MELMLFFMFGGLSVIFAMGMLLSKNAVHSALFLIGNFGSVAFLFVMLDAPFISMVQVAVYAGAIMVLFLFVIMLLGAEETSDTTRSFRWLTGVSTTLVLALLSSFAIPLVLGGINLPEPDGGQALVRVAHGANTIDVATVNIKVSGGTLEEPLVLENVASGDVTDFVALDAGTYTVEVNLPEGVEGVEDGNGRVLDASVPMLLPQTLTVEADSITTVLAYGTFDWNAKTFIEVDTIANDFSAPPAGEARFVVYNAYTDETLSLIDLGPNEVVDTRNRTVEVEGEEGEDPTEVIETYISDATIIADIQPNTTSEFNTYGDGTYTLAFVNEDFDVVMMMRDYVVEADTEHTVLLVPEALPGEPRPRVLDRDQEHLVTDTEPQFGSPMGIGRVLFTDYLLPVNLVGFLLLVGLVGVIVLHRPEGQKRERRTNRRRKVSRPLVSVIAQQTGTDLTHESPQLDQPTAPYSGD